MAIVFSLAHHALPTEVKFGREQPYLYSVKRGICGAHCLSLHFFLPLLQSLFLFILARLLSVEFVRQLSKFVNFIPIINLSIENACQYLNASFGVSVLP